MEIGRIHGCTRTLGQSQGYLGLPVRDEVCQDPQGHPVNAIVTAWYPLPHELEALNAGAPVYLRLLCITPPPMMVYAGSPPTDEEEAG